MYKITIADYIYIGHTNNFITRKKSHKSRCTDINNKCHHFKVYELIRQNGGWDKCEMTQIEEYEAESELEARIRENQLMNEYNANMNSRAAYTDKAVYQEEHKEETKQRCKEWYENNKQHHAEYGKKYQEENKQHLAECSKAYREAHIEENKAYQKAYREAHREELKAYREAHKEELNARKRAHRRAKKNSTSKANDRE
jgi:hypothetical protein